MTQINGMHSHESRKLRPPAWADLLNGGLSGIGVFLIGMLCAIPVEAVIRTSGAAWLYFPTGVIGVALGAYLSGYWVSAWVPSTKTASWIAVAVYEIIGVGVMLALRNSIQSGVARDVPSLVILYAVHRVWRTRGEERRRSRRISNDSSLRSP